jgi:hypothetical protein
MVSQRTATWTSSKSGWSYVQSTSAVPRTLLYMVSPPLPDPKDIVEIKIAISSHNQGWCDDPDSGLWAWLEASVIRPHEDNTLPLTEIAASPAFAGTRDSPEDFANAFLVKGWKLQPLSEDCYSFQIMAAPTSRTYQLQEILLRPTHPQSESRLAESVSSNLINKKLLMGDRIAFWIRSQVS